MSEIPEGLENELLLSAFHGGEGSRELLREMDAYRTQPARPDWDEYFLGIARAVAQRGDCTRRQVGCVLVDTDHRIIGTGYNGAEPGGPSCLDGECPRGRKSYAEAPLGSGGHGDCIAIHAEANALLFARTSCKGATAYVGTADPSMSPEVCYNCAKLLRGAGINRVVAR